MDINIKKLNEVRNNAIAKFKSENTETKAELLNLIEKQLSDNSTEIFNTLAGLVYEIASKEIHYGLISYDFPCYKFIRSDYLHGIKGYRLSSQEILYNSLKISEKNDLWNSIPNNEDIYFLKPKLSDYDDPNHKDIPLFRLDKLREIAKERGFDLKVGREHHDFIYYDYRYCSLKVKLNYIHTEKKKVFSKKK